MASTKPNGSKGFALTRKSPHQVKAETVCSKRSWTRDPGEVTFQAKHLLQIAGIESR